MRKLSAGEGIEMRQVLASLLVEEKLVNFFQKAVWQLCVENFKITDSL